MNISEEIKSRLDIVDIVREYMPNLKPVGVNFTALSPFKREKHPSFVVSPEKQIWHCFSTGKGGDVFTFVMEIEGISFVEALRLLAQKAGVTLRREDLAAQSQRNKLLDIMEEAVNFYHKNLMEGSNAAWARDYLKKRGLDGETAAEWQIGYSAESWADLIDFLKKKGFSDKEILLAGLSIKKEGKNIFYNRFRDRIMFPICDVNGNTVAFSARINPKKEEVEKVGKYINSPETFLYNKSKILFGLDKAKQAIREKDLAIAVEGQMDVITAHRAGFKNVVAISGTALTSEQLNLLKRYSDNVALAFDMDEAGHMAADRGISTAFGMEVNIKVITLPFGKDPDEVIKKDPEGFKEAVKNARHIMEYYFDRVFTPLDLEKIGDRRKAIKVLLPTINKFKNRVEQDFWVKKLGEATGANELELREELAKIRPEREVKKEEEEGEEPEERLAREEMLSENLLALIIKFPAFFEYIIDHLTLDHIFGQFNKLFYKNLIIYYNNIVSNLASREEKSDIKIDYSNFRDWINSQKNGSQDNQLKLLDKLVVLGDRDFFDLEMDKVKNEIIKIEVALKESYLTSRKKEIEKLIAEQEKEGNIEEAKTLMEELKVLTDESRKILEEREE